MINSTIPNAISANITAVSTYQDASVVVTKNFTGQEFIFGKKKIKVQNVTIWHKKGKIIFLSRLYEEKEFNKMIEVIENELQRS